MEKIAVIGGAGKMGRWFSSYFAKKGFEVSVFDTSFDSKKAADEAGAKHCKSAAEAIGDSEMVLVSVPLQKTIGCLDEIIPLMGNNRVILDISSVKETIFKTHKKSKTKFVSFHPLFGPSAASLSDQEIIFIKGSSPSHSKTLKELFSSDGAKVFEMTAREHDDLMSSLQQLPILLNLIFAEAISDNKNALSHGAPTFNSQLELCRKILSEDSEFYAFIQTENKSGRKLARKIGKILAKYKALLKSGDSKEMAKRFSELRDVVK